MATYWDTVLADNPLLYLRFGETSGAACANSGSLGGSATASGGYVRNFATGMTGPDVGIDLNGTTGKVDFPDNPALDITGDVTYECWINPDINTSAFLMDKGISGGGAGYGFLQAATELRPRVGSSNVFTTSGAGLAIGSWNHVAFTRSGNLFTVYRNGVSVGTFTSSLAAIATSDTLVIGRDNQGIGLFFDGKIDEVAIYNTALSGARIAAHYAARNNGNPAGSFTKVKFGTGLAVSDEGSGVIRVDAAPSVRRVLATWSGGLPAAASNGVVWRVPYDSDGSSFTFTLSRAFARIETSYIATISFRLESSPGGDVAFSPTTITAITIPAGEYETEITGLSTVVHSGDLLRLVFTAVGVTSNYQVELLGSQ